MTTRPADYQPQAICFAPGYIGTGTFHAVLAGAEPYAAALCGYRPSRLNGGYANPGIKVNCQRCSKRLEKIADRVL